MIDTLSKTNFALDDATVEAIEANPKEALPRLASNIYLTAVENSVAAIKEALPQIIEHHINTRTSNERNIGDFVKVWPGLKDHIDKVAPIGVMYRQLNPTASVEDFIKNVGEMAHATLGIAKPGPAPLAAPVSHPLRPHMPVAASAPRAPGGAAPVGNVYEQLAGARGQIDSDGDDPDN